MSRKSMQHTIALVLGLTLLVATNAAQATTLGRVVLGNGGARLTTNAASGARMTVGQTIIGRTSSTNNQGRLGFWYGSMNAGSTTGIAMDDGPLGNIPRAFALGFAAPNPFVYRTSIPYDVAAPSNVSLKVYDVQGRMIASLVDQHMQPGAYTVHFDAHDTANGVYFYKYVAGGQSMVKRFVLTR